MSLPVEFSRFPSHWDVLPFTKAIKDSTSGNVKIQKSEYSESGDIPIVDQGQSVFGGYTDDANAICKADLPTIIFGDHTRAFKYVEIPFALGADGAKVLEPVAKLDKRFLYHYLKQLRLESAGYSRHYKFLKETYVPVPPLAEQKRIAAILDKADAIRRKRQQAIQLADEFLRSVFLDMFGDIPAKKSPFEFKGCRGAVSAHSGKSSKAVLSDQITEIPIYGGNGVNGYATKALYDEPVIVVGRVGQQCAITHLTSGPSWVTDNAIVVKIVDKEKFEPVYLAHAFQNSPIRDVVTRLDLPFVNQAMILDHPIPNPPIELQRKYVDIYRKVLTTVGGQNKAADYSFNCFNSLSQKAFSGQL